MRRSLRKFHLAPPSKVSFSSGAMRALVVVRERLSAEGLKLVP